MSDSSPAPSPETAPATGPAVGSVAADPRVNADFTLMVRQLDPTPSGLPLELYFFTRTTAWVEYEHIQSEIFARLYAVLPRFGLRVFQTPAGSDISALRLESEPSDASQR